MPWPSADFPFSISSSCFNFKLYSSVLNRVLSGFHLNDKQRRLCDYYICTDCPVLYLHFQSSSDLSKFRKQEENGEIIPEDESSQKFKSMWIRTLSTFWMIAGFVVVVYMGHLYIWAMIVVIQLYMGQELFTLARAAQREKQLPGFRLLNWYVCLF